MLLQAESGVLISVNFGNIDHKLHLTHMGKGFNIIQILVIDFTFHNLIYEMEHIFCCYRNQAQLSIGQTTVP